MVLRTTIGVFVNLLVDNKSRLMFKNKKGVKHFLGILNIHGHRDWVLAMLVCEALWNYSIDASNLNDIFSEEEVQELLGLLADSLGTYLLVVLFQPTCFVFSDEDRIFGVSGNANDSDIFVTQEYMLWEEYASVATNLLEKIEYFLDTTDGNSDASEDRKNSNSL